VRRARLAVRVLGAAALTLSTLAVATTADAAVVFNPDPVSVLQQWDPATGQWVMLVQSRVDGVSSVVVGRDGVVTMNRKPTKNQCGAMTRLADGRYQVHCYVPGTVWVRTGAGADVVGVDVAGWAAVDTQGGKDVIWARADAGFSVHAGNGDDNLATWGGGNISTEGGRDTVHSKDGRVDDIYCGDGADNLTDTDAGDIRHGC
jgi:hypothetical protein